MPIELKIPKPTKVVRYVEAELFPEAEKAAHQHLVDFTNVFNDLPEYHPCDRADVLFHVHAIQSILMSRIAVRVLPNEFLNVNGRTL